MSRWGIEETGSEVDGSRTEAVKRRKELTCIGKEQSGPGARRSGLDRNRDGVEKTRVDQEWKLAEMKRN